MSAPTADMLHRARETVHKLTGSDPGETSPWGDVVAGAIAEAVAAASRAGFDAAVKLLRDSTMISSNPLDIAIRRDAADYLEAIRQLIERGLAAHQGEIDKSFRAGLPKEPT